MTAAPEGGRAPRDRRRTRVALVVAALGAVVALGGAYVLFTTNVSTGRPQVTLGGSPLLGRPAPEIDLLDVDGRRVRLSDYRGRPVIVNFWATWCEPCKEEFPLFRAAREEHADAGLEILGVIHDDSTAAARRFAASRGAHWPLLDDPEDVAFRAYGSLFVPMTYYVDRAGIVRDVSFGPPPRDVFDRQVAGIVGSAGAPPTRVGWTPSPESTTTPGSTLPGQPKPSASVGPTASPPGPEATSTAEPMSMGPSSPAAAPPRLALERVADGLELPVFVTHAGDERLFIIEQEGRIRIVDRGAVRERPFIDIAEAVSCCGEQGMLGLAFHPEYASNGRSFVSYVDRRGDLIVSEFARAGRDRADRSSERVILRVLHREYIDHYGGMLEFGPDGFLYVSTGDGGGVGDPGRNAQDLESLLGKILRLDVDAGTGEAYAVPSDNPFVGRPGRDEIWSYGLRNPWRFSFDPLTGDLWIGDVGQDRYEEVHRHADGRAVNFGWDIVEGRHCNRPRQDCDRSGLDLPVVELKQEPQTSQAIVGGYVYRGSGQPGLAGWYLFAETYLGPIWAIPADAGRIVELPAPLDTDLVVTSFGRDVAGEILLTAYLGEVYRVVER